MTHYHGTITDDDDGVIWKCTHQHPTPGEAQNCAFLEQTCTGHMPQIKAMLDHAFDSGPPLSSEEQMCAKIALADALLNAWSNDLDAALLKWQRDTDCDCGACAAFREIVAYVAKIDEDNAAESEHAGSCEDSQTERANAAKFNRLWGLEEETPRSDE